MFSFLATIGTAGSYWLVRREFGPAGASRAHLCRLSDGEAGTLVGSGIVPHLYAFDVAMPADAPSVAQLVAVTGTEDPSLVLVLAADAELQRGALRFALPDSTPETARKLAEGFKLEAASAAA